MKYIVMCPKTGVHHDRPATEEEVAAYLAQEVRHPSFRKPVKVGEVLIDEEGEALWFGGAGF